MSLVEGAPEGDGEGLGPESVPLFEGEGVGSDVDVPLPEGAGGGAGGGVLVVVELPDGAGGEGVVLVVFPAGAGGDVVVPLPKVVEPLPVVVVPLPITGGGVMVLEVEVEVVVPFVPGSDEVVLPDPAVVELVYELGALVGPVVVLFPPRTGGGVTLPVVEVVVPVVDPSETEADAEPEAEVVGSDPVEADPDPETDADPEAELDADVVLVPFVASTGAEVTSIMVQSSISPAPPLTKFASEQT